MAKELLTATGLEAKFKQAQRDALARNTRIKISDGNNLYLVVRPSGGASWQLVISTGGVRKPATLAEYPAATLKRARELAKKARDESAGGIDLVAKRRAEREVAKKAIKEAKVTVRTTFEGWLKAKGVSPLYEGNITAAFIKDVLPAIGSLHPGEVTRSQVMEILRTIEARNSPVMLRRVRMYLKQMYEYAMEMGTVEHTPVPGHQLRSFIKGEKGHFPAVTDYKEVPGLLKAISGYGSPVVRNLMVLSAHLFQRPTELRASRWSDFDLEEGVWKISADRTKMDREHWVPLSPQVVELLKVHQGIVGDEGWVFPGRRYDQPLSEGAIASALETLGYKGRHCHHGFRATARTVIAERLKLEPDLIEKQLAHKTDKSGLNGAYDRTQFWDDRVALMQQWSSWVCAQTSDPQSMH
jgi:integrase